MRISETKVVQLVETDPPQLVIVDDLSGAEIALTPHEVEGLETAIAYFDPYLHGTYSPLDSPTELADKNA